MRTTTSLGLALAMLVGCAVSAEYIYWPHEARIWTDGYPTAITSVPPEAPQGTIEVKSSGIVAFEPGVALHVRIAITNEGDATPWKLVPSDQLIVLSSESRVRPFHVNADGTAPAELAIAQRERRVVDLYYRMPPTIRRDDDLRSFELLWQIITPARTFASRTAFTRLEEPPPTNVVFYSAHDPYWRRR